MCIWAETHLIVLESTETTRYSYVIDGWTPGNYYKVMIVAMNSQGEGAPEWYTLSLEMVDVFQIISMHCQDGGMLKVSMTISVAPGPLLHLTEIACFCLRYVLVNQLSRSIRLW